MILRGILRGIMFIIDGIAKIAAWLLGALGLWLPALYSFIFFITCAIDNVKIEGSTATFFFVGLILSFVGSVLIALNKINREKRKKTEAAAERTVEKVVKKSGANAKLVTYEDDEIFKPTEEESTPEKEPFVNDGITEVITETGKKPVPRIYQEITKESLALENKEKKKEQEKKASLAEGFIPYHKAEESSLAESQETKTLVLEEEKPRVFKVRYDPTIVVYEYSNRLEFFKRTRQGLVLMQTKMK